MKENILRDFLYSLCGFIIIAVLTGSGAKLFSEGFPRWIMISGISFAITSFFMLPYFALKYTITKLVIAIVICFVGGFLASV